MHDRLQRWLPTEEKLRAHRSLRWLGPVLRRPWLWQLTRRRVAAGAAAGVFFGLLIPVLQIPCAALAAVAMRANLPVAVVGTLVSNPLTYAPIFVAAHRTGTALLGSDDLQSDTQSQRSLAAFAEQIEADGDLPPDWKERMVRIGKPLMLGLAVFAVVGAALAWVGVNLAWMLLARL